MVYHGLTVSKHHVAPWFLWYIMVFHHGLPVSKHHGILPWNTMVYFHKERYRERERGRGGRGGYI